MTTVTVKKSEYDKMQRELSKLHALEAGGVDNWDNYDDALAEWFKENEVDELLDNIIADMNDVLVDAEVDQPAGQGCGYSIRFDEATMRKILLERLKEYKEIVG